MSIFGPVMEIKHLTNQGMMQVRVPTPQICRTVVRPRSETFDSQRYRGEYIWLTVRSTFEHREQRTTYTCYWFEVCQADTLGWNYTRWCGLVGDIHALTVRCLKDALKTAFTGTLCDKSDRRANEWENDPSVYLRDNVRQAKPLILSTRRNRAPVGSCPQTKMTVRDWRADSDHCDNLSKTFRSHQRPTRTMNSPLFQRYGKQTASR